MTKTVEVIDYRSAWERYARMNLSDQVSALVYPDKRSLYIDVSELPQMLFDALLTDSHLQGLYLLDALSSSRIDTKFPINLRFVRTPMRKTPRDMTSARVGKWVRIEGIVRKMSEPHPLITEACYECENGHRMMIPVKNRQEDFTHKCDMCGSRNLRLLPEKSKIIDTQHFYLQEFPENLQGGEIPAEIEVEVYDDDCWSVVPGNRIFVSGILHSYRKKKESQILDVFIVANSIEKDEQSFTEIEISEEDEEKIRAISTRTDLREFIFDQISPSIYGYFDIKRAVALQLFGGVTYDRKDGTTKRGDIHVLLLGDPSCGKSQLIKSIFSVCPRGILTSGHTSSKAGLTAAAIQDAAGGWILEAGAAVLADGGSLFVDELDKMKSEDRSSLHQVMEQQELSIAKAGFTVTLPTRCSILAAGNPKLGRFDRCQNIFEQVDLPPTLLSRFDLIFLMEDVADEDSDRSLTDHILVGGSSDWDRSMLRKYIAYARMNVHPKISHDAGVMLQDYYVRIRKMSDGSKPMKVGVRQFDGLMRLCEASARMRLSEVAELEDAQYAITAIDPCLKAIAYTPPTGQLNVFGEQTMTKNVSKKDGERAILTRIIEYMEEEKKKGNDYVAFDDILNHVNTHLPPGAIAFTQLNFAYYTVKLQQEGMILKNQRDKYKLL